MAVELNWQVTVCRALPIPACNRGRQLRCCRRQCLPDPSMCKQRCAIAVCRRAAFVPLEVLSAPSAAGAGAPAQVGDAACPPCCSVPWCPRLGDAGMINEVFFLAQDRDPSNPAFC